MNIASISSQVSSTLFSRLDSKKQGYIEQSDLNTAFAKINGDTSSTDIEAVFNQIDKDEDGKITKSELTQGIASLLSQLQSNISQSSAQTGNRPPPPDGDIGMGMPPPPPLEDTGVTYSQASEIAASSEDSPLANLMSMVAENFEDADENSDGRVTAEEAMTYQKQQQSQESTTSDSEMKLQRLLQQLVSAYGIETQFIGETVDTIAS